MAKTKVCAFCGKTFVCNTNCQRYCSKECNRLNQNAMKSKWYGAPEMEKNYKEQQALTAREYRKRVRKSRAVLVDINEKAREAGMTYGQYVAQMEMRK